MKDIKIAYAIAQKNKPKKKMAQGGPVSAATEARPMPETKINDAHMIKRAEAPKAKLQSLAQPSMVKSSVIKSSPIDALGRKIPSTDDMSPMKHKGMSEDKGPAEEEYMDDEMRPRLAKGGMINGEISMEEAEEDQNPGTPARKPDDHRLPKDEYMADHFAKGGYVDENEQPLEEAEEEKHASIAAAIMARRRMAYGGNVSTEDQVDIDKNNDEQPNAYYKANKAALKENYDEDFEDMTQPMDSNEHGDDIESDVHDMISQIRSKIKHKR